MKAQRVALCWTRADLTWAPPKLQPEPLLSATPLSPLSSKGSSDAPGAGTTISPSMGTCAGINPAVTPICGHVCSIHGLIVCSARFNRIDACRCPSCQLIKVTDGHNRLKWFRWLTFSSGTLEQGRKGSPATGAAGSPGRCGGSHRGL